MKKQSPGKIFIALDIGAGKVVTIVADASGGALERADLRYPNGLAIAWHGASPGVCQENVSKNGEIP